MTSLRIFRHQQKPIKICSKSCLGKLSNPRYFYYIYIAMFKRGTLDRPIQQSLHMPKDIFFFDALYVSLCHMVQSATSRKLRDLTALALAFWHVRIFYKVHMLPLHSFCKLQADCVKHALNRSISSSIPGKEEGVHTIPTRLGVRKNREKDLCWPLAMETMGENSQLLSQYPERMSCFPHMLLL